MALSNVATGDIIRAADHNSLVDYLKGTAGSGEAMLLVYNAAGVITLTPSTNPAAATELIIVNNAAGTRQFAITAGGDLVGTGGILTLPAGADTLVGLATTDVLTNKTLTAPTIADFTNAAHDHGDADDGGSLASGITITSPVINTQLTGTAVGTGASQVAAGNHTHAAGKTMKYHYAEPGTDISTTSTSLVDATGLTVTFTPASATNDIFMTYSLATQNNSASNNFFAFHTGAATFFHRYYNITGEWNISGHGKQTDLAAASTVIKLQYAVSAGTQNIFGTGTYDSNMLVTENS